MVLIVTLDIIGVSRWWLNSLPPFGLSLMMHLFIRRCILWSKQRSTTAAIWDFPRFLVFIKRIRTNVSCIIWWAKLWRVCKCVLWLCDITWIFYCSQNDSYYQYLNALCHQTILIPKEGKQTNVQPSYKIFLYFFHEDASWRHFTMFHIIWEEIRITSWYSLKSCTHAPYIMRILKWW